MTRYGQSTKDGSARKDVAQAGYANARVRGMRSHLLSPESISALVDLPDITTVIQALDLTPYGPEVQEATLQGRSAAQVDDGLRQNMVHTYRRVLGFMSQPMLGVLETLLGRWDVFNIKTILRAKNMHLGFEEIEAGLLAVASLAPVDLDALSRLPDVRSVIDTLATWRVPYARALGRAYPEFSRTGNLAVLELALDSYYFAWASDRLSGKGIDRKSARQLMAVQADTTNLVTVFRLQQADLGEMRAEEFFLPGGKYVNRQMYIELAGKSDIDEVLDALGRTPYGAPLEGAAEIYLEENAISVLERALEDYMMRKAVALGLGDPFSVGIPVSYLWAKSNEVTNLRVVVKGVASGLPAERIRRELIVV